MKYPYPYIYSLLIFDFSLPVLFRLKPGVTQAQLAHWSQMSKAMVGKIPGMSPTYTYISQDRYTICLLAFCKLANVHALQA